MSRLDKLKEQHPELNMSVMDVLGKIDPTNTYKYMEFLIKKFKEFYSEYDDWSIGLGIEMMGSDNMDALNEFERHAKANRITNPDISQYKDFNQINDAVKEAEEKVRLKELASKTYGANTKWCTTQERYWNEYYKTYKLIYIQNKKTNEKYAVSRHWEDNKKVQAWMSNDDESSPMLLPLPIEVMSVILCEVNKTDTIFELQSRHNIVEGTKSKKGGRPDVFDDEFASYLNEYSRNDVETTARNIYAPYVSNNSWGFENNDGLSMRDIIRRLTTTD